MQDKQSQLILRIFWAIFLIAIIGLIPEILKTLSPSLAELTAALISTFIILPFAMIAPVIIPIGIAYFLIVCFRKKS